MASNPLICIVDDSDDYRFLLGQLFSRELSAYSTRLFTSGKAFLAQLPQLDQNPQLILLDRHMPGLDGHQTLVQLKQQEGYRRIPVVMMSADASVEEIDGCYGAGVNGFVRKQIDFNSLKSVMKATCQYWLEINQGPSTD